MQELTQEILKSILHYAPLTGVWTWINPASRNIKAGDIAGSRRGRYNRIQIWGSGYQSARLAFLYMRGYWPKDLMDHKDRDSLNDQWDNLREATSSQNNFNRYEGIRGVYAAGNKWRAQVGPKNDLGLFDTYDEAIIVRDEAAARLGGEFAILNRDLVL